MFCTPATLSLNSQETSYYSKTCTSSTHSIPNTHARERSEMCKGTNQMCNCVEWMLHCLIKNIHTKLVLSYFCVYFCLLSLASFFWFLLCVFFPVFHIFIRLLSRHLSEMLSAEGWALGIAYTKVVHTHTHIYIYNAHICNTHRQTLWQSFQQI